MSFHYNTLTVCERRVAISKCVSKNICQKMIVIASSLCHVQSYIIVSYLYVLPCVTASCYHGADRTGADGEEQLLCGQLSTCLI